MPGMRMRTVWLQIMFVPAVMFVAQCSRAAIVAQGCWQGIFTADTSLALRRPYALTTSSLGEVLVGAEGGLVGRFSGTGSELDSWTYYPAVNPMRVIGGLDTDSQGFVYATDIPNHRLRKFTASGDFVTEWGGFGPGQGTLELPGDVAVDAAGFVYVVERQFAKIQKFTSAGASVSQWSTVRPTDRGGEIYGIACDDSGFVYVADAANTVIKKYTNSGAFVRMIGGTFPNPGYLSQPWGVAASRDNILYVTDLGRNMVIAFTTSGEFIEEWGGLGSGEGQFSWPYAVTTDDLGNVYVADSQNSRVCKFGPGPTPAKRSSWGAVKVMYR